MKYFQKNKILVLGLVLVFLLLFKNPFSGNNVISNLEPSPDASHYLSPVKSFVEGKGFFISYQERKIPAQVPPLYSFSLIPFYLITSDIRSFYFFNVLLALFSSFLFYKIVTKIFTSRLISTILYSAFITNFVIFLYPSFAMAENLLLPLFLCSIWLIINPLTKKSLILLSLLTVGFVATKYVAWILSLSLILIVIIKAKRARLLKRFFLYVVDFFLIYIYIEYLSRGEAFLNTIKISLTSFLEVFLSFFQSSPSSLSTGNFSKDYFSSNLIRHLAGIMGGPAVVAGSYFIILPVIVGFTSLFAIFINLFVSRYKLLSLYFLLSVIGTLYYVSTFVVADSRYLLAFIPAFLIIFGLFLESLCNFFNRINRKIYTYVLICFVYIAIIFSVTLSAFYQIRINFFGTERSANLDAIMTMNSYTSLQIFRPVIISVLSPYQIDFFSNQKYDLLPISKTQYFTDKATNVWGIDLTGNIIDIYKDFLKEGRIVLVSNYLTGEKSWYKFDLDKIKENFELKEVATGCNNTCNLYKIDFK